MTSLAPIPKVFNAGLAGALTAIFLFVFAEAVPDVSIPASIASAVTVVISSIFGYFTPSSVLPQDPNTTTPDVKTL